MVKKIIEENLDSNEKEKIEIETDFKAEEALEEIKDTFVSKGTPFTVYKIEGNELILIDSQGCGLRITLPEQYKTVKPGDIVYL